MARTYPQKKCKNPECPNKSFTPRRSNQLFCEGGCKDNYHNDKRREENTTVFHREKQLRRNAKTLEMLHKDPDYKTGVPVNILKLLKIDLMVCTHQRKNPTTEKTVYWFHNYGLESTGVKPSVYLIHHSK